MFLKKLMRIYTQLMWKPIISTYDWLLPPTCILCGYFTHNKHNICNLCQNDLPILPHSCQQCAQFLPFTQSPKCGGCLSDPPAFNHTYALFPYEHPINRLITQLKFQHQLSTARALGEMMAQRIQDKWYINKPFPDLIIPIPLHSKRLCERGFNQALEIAKPIAKALTIPIDYHGVKRTKNTFAQSGLPAEERKRNITRAFYVSRDYTGLSIAVIDDVITTGHTVMECCRMLKRNGAVNIDIWCCARNG